jgi:hypothetical protein
MLGSCAGISGIPCEELHDEMLRDGLSEYLNVLAGNTVCILERQGIATSLSSPRHDRFSQEGKAFELAEGLLDRLGIGVARDPEDPVPEDPVAAASRRLRNGSASRPGDPSPRAPSSRRLGWCRRSHLARPRSSSR